MITGKIKNQVDAIWMSFWTGGITNSIDVLEQMTYLFFMKMVDDAQLSQEAKAAMMGMGDVELPDAVFKKGLWHNPDTGKDVRPDVQHRTFRCLHLHQEPQRCEDLCL